MDKTKVLIAMSGGVDSAVAALLMQEQGHGCVGITMRLFDNEDAGVSSRTCCSLQDAEEAERVANRLGIPFYVFNFSDDFRKRVIGRFVEEYQRGATPNPCIDCNRFIKFERLFERAVRLGMDYVVTGHYARVEFYNGRYLLKKGADASKDQSYVLYAMTQEQLSRTLFPLGGMTKAEARALAARRGFSNAEKPDSQDICFVPNGDYAEFITRYSGEECPDGDYIDTAGNVLGRHKGHIRYTIGQRKGLAIALGKPMFVCAKNASANTVTLCEGDELYSRELYAEDFNWITFDDLGENEIRVKAKIRYNQKEQPATVRLAEGGRVHIVFDEPQRAIAAGQAVVLYDGDIVVGGGTIRSCSES